MCVCFPNVSDSPDMGKPSALFSNLAIRAGGSTCLRVQVIRAGGLCGHCLGYQPLTISPLTYLLCVHVMHVLM